MIAHIYSHSPLQHQLFVFEAPGEWCIINNHPMPSVTLVTTTEPTQAYFNASRDDVPRNSLTLSAVMEAIGFRPGENAKILSATKEQLL